MSSLKLRVVQDTLDAYPDAANAAALKSLHSSIENGGIGGASWVDERQSLIVLDENDNCWGVMQWDPDLQTGKCLYINWAHSDHPRAFTLMAVRMRKIAKELKAKRITFTVFFTNERMRRMASTLGAVERSVHYQVTF